jgi:hypothetical protein
MRPKKKLDLNVVPIAAHEKHGFCQIEVERGIVTAFRKEAIARGTNTDRLIRDVLNLISSSATSSSAPSSTTNDARSAESPSPQSPHVPIRRAQSRPRAGLQPLAHMRSPGEGALRYPAFQRQSCDPAPFHGIRRANFGWLKGWLSQGPLPESPVNKRFLHVWVGHRTI